MFIFWSSLCTQKNPKTHQSWSLIDCGWLVNEKGPGFRTQATKSCKRFPKNFAHDYIYQLAKCHDQMIYDLRYIFQNILYIVC